LSMGREWLAQKTDSCRLVLMD